jgi:hypothetical protein
MFVGPAHTLDISAMRLKKKQWRWGTSPTALQWLVVANAAALASGGKVPFVH